MKHFLEKNLSKVTFLYAELKTIIEKNHKCNKTLIARAKI